MDYFFVECYFRRTQGGVTVKLRRFSFKKKVQNVFVIKQNVLYLHINNNDGAFSPDIKN